MRTSALLLLSLVSCVSTLDPHTGDAAFDQVHLFEGQRFPCVAVGTDGTVIATWGAQKLLSRRSVDGGATWEDEVHFGDGISGGGVVVNDANGEVFAFGEEGHPPARITVYRSTDSGASWTPEPLKVEPNSLGHMPSMHMNDTGLTLRYGQYPGRLIRPTRYYAGANAHEKWPEHYTNAMYSDDGGETWQASEPFPEYGTGEATITELSSGRLYYNSRVHWQERPQNTRRRHAFSDDGGYTWTDWSVVEVLPDGHQHRSYGCMGGLARLDLDDRDILIFSNIDTENAKRENVTVWASFDGGATWPIKRLVQEGPGAYSSLAAGRRDTPSEGWIYLQYERQGCQLARFNLAWILGGEPTGDGEVPSWVTR